MSTSLKARRGSVCTFPGPKPPERPADCVERQLLSRVAMRSYLPASSTGRRLSAETLHIASERLSSLDRLPSVLRALVGPVYQHHIRRHTTSPPLCGGKVATRTRKISGPAPLPSGLDQCWVMPELFSLVQQ